MELDEILAGLWVLALTGQEGVSSQNQAKQKILSKYLSKEEVLRALGREEWDEGNVRDNPIAEVVARNQLRQEIKKDLGL